MNAVAKDIVVNPGLNKDETERVRVEQSRRSNMGWENERIAAAENSKKTAWRIAAISVAVTVIAVAAVFVQGPLRRIEPIPLVVDRLTGETTVGTRLAADTIPPLDALDKHNLAKFIRAREGYNWAFLQSQYDTVLRMATPGVFQDYSKLFEGGDNALDKKLGASGDVKANVLLIRLPPGGRNGNRGEATVSFEKVTRMPNQTIGELKRYVATIYFEYRPSLLQKEQDRIENPFGFLVTAYRSDLEMTDASASIK